MIDSQCLNCSSLWQVPCDWMCPRTLVQPHHDRNTIMKKQWELRDRLNITLDLLWKGTPHIMVRKKGEKRVFRFQCRPSPQHEFNLDIDGLVQDYSIASALAVEILQSCTMPSIWHGVLQYRHTMIRAFFLHIVEQGLSQWKNALHLQHL